MKAISTARRNYIFPELPMIQESGLTLVKIECEEIKCPDKSFPVQFPGNCCPKCGMISISVVS